MIHNQQQLKALLTDTITMLCKNSVTFHQEISIEGLIGITLDQKDIVLVNIKEILPSRDDSENAVRPNALVSIKSLKQKHEKKSVHKTLSAEQNDESSEDFSETGNNVHEERLNNKSRKISSTDSSASHSSDDINIKAEPTDDFESDIMIVKEEPESSDHSVTAEQDFSQDISTNLTTNDNEFLHSPEDFNNIKNVGSPEGNQSGVGFQSDSSQVVSPVYLIRRNPSNTTTTSSSHYSLRSAGSSRTSSINKRAISRSPSPASSMSSGTSSSCSSTSSSSKTKFICGMCGKEYGQAPALYRHKAIVHLKKDYNCRVCSKKFSRKDTLRTHVLMIHGPGIE